MRWGPLFSPPKKARPKSVRDFFAAACLAVGEALVDPEEFALHGLLVVGGGKAVGAVEFAVPGVDVFVGEEAGEAAFAAVGIEDVFLDFVVGGFVVFGSAAAGAVEGDEPVVL